MKKKNKAHRFKKLFQAHKGGKWQSWASTLIWSDLKAHNLPPTLG